MSQPRDGEWYEASDGQWYRWPDPTPHSKPPPPPPPGVTPPASTTPETTDPARKGAAIGTLVAGGMLVVGSLLPWMQINAGFVSASRNGVQDGGDGVYFIIAGLILAAAGAGVLVGYKLPRWIQSSPLVIGAVALAITIYDFLDVQKRVSEANDEEYVLASIGAGLYLVGLGALAAFASGWVLRQTNPARGQPTARSPIPDDGIPY